MCRGGGVSQALQQHEDLRSGSQAAAREDGTRVGTSGGPGARGEGWPWERSMLTSEIAMPQATNCFRDGVCLAAGRAGLWPRFNCGSCYLQAV